MEMCEKISGVVWPSLPTTNPPLPLTGLPKATVTLSNSSPLILAGGTVYALQGDALVPQSYNKEQGTLVALAKDEKGVLVVSEDKKLLRVGADCEEDLSLAGGVISVAATLQHCLALGPTGALFCRGVPPLLGNTSPSPEFVRVSLLEGLEVVQVAVGEDFSVVLARKRDPGVITPQDGKQPSEPEELCPLGLQVGLVANGDGVEEPQSKSAGKLSNEALNGTQLNIAEQETKSINSPKETTVSGVAEVVSDIKCTDDCVDGNADKTEQDSADTCAESEQSSVVGNFLQETLEESYKQMALMSDESTELKKYEEEGIAEDRPESKESADPYEDEGEKTYHSEQLERKPDLAEICASVTSSGSLMEPFPNSLGYVAGLGRSLYSSLTRTSTSSLTTTPPLSRSPSRTPSLTSSRGSTPSLMGNSSHSVAVSSMRESGERLGATLVFCWGQARRGQLGQGDMLARPSPSLLSLPSLTTVTKVAAGARHALALTDCGEVWGWGDNSKGQLGPGMAALLNPTLVSLPKGETARDISCSSQASLVVMGSGRFLLLGSPGIASTGDRLQVLAPPLDPGLTPISGILLSCGGVAASVATQHPATLSLVQGEQTLLRSTRAMLALLQSLVPRGAEESSPLLKVRELFATLHSILISCVFSSNSSSSSMISSNSTTISSICTNLESASRTGVLSNLPPLATAFSALQVSFVGCSLLKTVSLQCLSAPGCCVQLCGNGLPSAG